MIRSLKPGEAVPTGTPRRYRNARGYILLRWRIGTNELVECYEHRVFDGRVTTAEHVHHINHIRDDNRPENLQRMTAEEHRRQHPGENDEECARMYRAGMNTVEIAAALGINPATVSRALRRCGVQTRSPNVRRIIAVDEAELRRLYDCGYAVDRISELMGVERTVLRRRMDALGIPPRPLGYRTPAHLSRSA